MRDLNFFEEYIEKFEFKFDEKVIIIGLCILTFLFLVIYTLYSSIAISQQAKAIHSLKAAAEEPLILKRVEKIREKEIEINEFRESVEKIRYLDETLSEKDIINEALLATITSKIPSNLFLTSLGVYDNEMEIVGISKDKWAVAEFKKGLEDLGYMEDLGEIFVSAISQENDYYNFTINISLKDVDEDEEDNEPNETEDGSDKEIPSEEPED